MNLIIPDWPGAPASVRALSSTRQGGCSGAPYDDGLGAGGLNLGMQVGDCEQKVRQNRVLLRERLPAEPVWLSQAHGVQVIDAASVDRVPVADASFTRRPGVVCVVQTADCLPVLFCDDAGRVVAAAHAGWRSLAGGILQRTVERMRDAGAGEILAWLGPAIGPECFEVGQDVVDAFPKHGDGVNDAFIPLAGGIELRCDKYLANIYTLAKQALGFAGVDRISGGQACTMTETGRFYSYRRAAVTGRMASLIWINRTD